jgi:predicted GNAT family acetyltransferase
MELRRFADPAAFYDRAAPFLLADEAAHILPIGLVTTFIRQPSSAPGDLYMATVEGAGEVVAAALMTPPLNLILSRVASPAAFDVIADDLLARRPLPPGVHAPAPISRQFAECWCARTGQAFHHAMAQRIYQLEQVVPVVGVLGELRQATVADREVLVAMSIAFNAEAESVVDAERVARWADDRLDSPTSGLHLWWHDDRPVAMVGYAGPTPSGIKIGPVYTPLEHRRQGFGSAATVALSQLLLDSGHRCCFLFTDLANPTSNHIYQAVGYRPVCDVDEFRFSPSPRSQNLLVPRIWP